MNLLRMVLLGMLVTVVAAPSHSANPFKSAFESLKKIGSGNSDGSEVEPESSDNDQETPDETSAATQLKPQGEMRFMGMISKNANMRSGPTTSDPVVIVIPPGTQVAIAPKQGDWYQTHAIVNDQPVTGWVYHTLIETLMVEFTVEKSEPKNPIKNFFARLKSSGEKKSQKTDATKTVGPAPAVLNPQGDMRYSGMISKSANMRSGPTTTDSIVVTIPPGTQVAIAPKQGDWYQTHAIVNDQPVTGWVYYTLIETLMVELTVEKNEVSNPIENFFSRLQKNGGSKSKNADAKSDSSSGPSPVVLQPQGDMKYLGMIAKSANMRSGPTTTDSIVVTIPPGTQVAIAPKQGDWYQTYAIVKDQAVNGWIYHTLVETQMVEMPVSENAELQAGLLDISYSGYSEYFLDIRKMLSAGELSKIDETFAAEEAEIRAGAKNEDQFNKKIGLLRWLERGTFALDQGLYDGSQTYFSTSESLVEEKEGGSIVGGMFGKVFTQALETISGNEEFGPYSADGWEKVLMLNYKTIAYLLQGDRRAYNVTRRAIDWQNIEKKAFDKSVANSEEKLEKEYKKEEGKREKEAEKTEQDPAENNAPNPALPQNAIIEVLNRVLEPMDKKASSVASAYVNPFGFYVAGMIQEFESYSDRNLRDNARISYSKALELNPKSKVLAGAVKDMKERSASPDINLVHVIVADGFVPEKKVLTYNLETGAYGVLPLKLSINESVPSTVDHIEVHSKTGKHLATLSTVADVEALCLRQQKDMQKLKTMEALTSTLLSGFIEHTARDEGGVLGAAVSLVGKARQSNAAPDTRSWMSLPATIQATRLHLNRGVAQIKIVSFNKSGKRIASQLVDLNPESHGVVYVRTVNSTMYAQVTDKLWM